jgi:hypothetical protein
MLYTISILLSGVYLGQEYDVIPSIKIIFTNMILYLNTLKEPTNTFYYERFKRFLGL